VTTGVPGRLAAGSKPRTYSFRLHDKNGRLFAITIAPFAASWIVSYDWKNFDQHQLCNMQ